MKNDDSRPLFGIRCLSGHHAMRRLVLAMLTLVICFASTSASAYTHRRRGPPVDERTIFPSSFDLSNQIGPLNLSTATFEASGTDAKGLQHDQWITGHALGVDKLVFDQVQFAIRIGVYNHFSIGVPIAFGMAPMSVTPTPSNSASISVVRADGNFAGLLGIGISPSYEINFGDSAFRFDAQVLARGILVPTNLTTVNKHGQTVAEDAVAGQIIFEPRLTILPYAHKDLGLGFYGEVDAVHPENWSCGLVIQARFGTKEI